MLSLLMDILLYQFHDSFILMVIPSITFWSFFVASTLLAAAKSLLLLNVGSILTLFLPFWYKFFEKSGCAFLLNGTFVFGCFLPANFLFIIFGLLFSPLSRSFFSTSFPPCIPILLARPGDTFCTPFFKRRCRALNSLLAGGVLGLL